MIRNLRDAANDLKYMGSGDIIGLIVVVCAFAVVGAIA